jgi:hypothetical protein
MSSFSRLSYFSSSAGLSLIFFVLTAASLLAHDAPVLIRVNQIGYEVGISARAYVMTSQPVGGVSYFLKIPEGRALLAERLDLRGDRGVALPFIPASSLMYAWRIARGPAGGVVNAALESHL